MYKNLSDLQIFKEIIVEYIYKIPHIRILILPTFLFMIMSRYLEVKLSDYAQTISKIMDLDDGSNGVMVYYALTSVISIFLIEFQGFIFTGAVQRAFRVASRDTFNYFMSLDPKVFNTIGTGEIQATIDRKSKAVSEIIDVAILNLIPTVLVIWLSNIKIAKTLGIIPLVIVNLTVMLYAIITIRIAIWRSKIRSSMNIYINKSSNKLYDSLSNHETASSFNNEYLEVKNYDKTLVKTEASANKLWRSMYLLNFIQRLLFAIQTISVIYFGTSGILGRKMRSDEFVLYLTITKILSNNLSNLGYMYCRYTQAMVNAKVTYGVNMAHTAQKFMPIRNITKDIKFKDISVQYNQEILFSGVSFTIEKGQKVALIGNNGVGKSTLLKTLLKFNTYTGNIYIDDNDIQYISNSSLRSFISYVPQNPTLFNETVKYNIKYGNTKASDDDVIELAKKYRINDSICRLSEGYETKVGELGRNLSGGERQKVALLRALLKGMSFVVMDEPTAALDKVSEFTMFSEIVKIPDLTLLVIIHNLDLLHLFDKIVVLEKTGAREILNTGTNDLKGLISNITNYVS